MIQMTQPLPELVVRRVAQAPTLHDGFDATAWSAVPATAVARFHPRSTSHQPPVWVRVAYTAAALHLVWRVIDRYVVSRVTVDSGDVCTDSCVECFLAPIPGQGHVNVEVNAGGVALASHVTRTTPFTARLFSPPELQQIGRRGTLPSRIDREIISPCTWDMAVTIPFELLSARYGAPVTPTGTWRANLYKCADRSSHPHWASWASIGDILSFHQPERFGVWRFDPV